VILKALVAGAAMCVLGLVAVAQTPTPSVTQGVKPPPDELETLSNTWMEAAQRHDMATLERLMAEEFILVHPSQDNVTTRAQWLAALARIQTTQFKYEHLRVVRHGDTLGVVSSRFVVEALRDGQPFPAITGVVDIWEKRDGRWQVVTRYAARPEELRGPSPGPTPR
jgi:ketosteroid isomerase-like protein